MTGYASTFATGNGRRVWYGVRYALGATLSLQRRDPRAMGTEGHPYGNLPGLLEVGDLLR